MHIASVGNTELFVGTEQDPRQVLAVELGGVDHPGMLEVTFNCDEPVDYRSRSP